MKLPVLIVCLAAALGLVALRVGIVWWRGSGENVAAGVSAEAEPPGAGPRAAAESNPGLTNQMTTRRAAPPRTCVIPALQGKRLSVALQLLRLAELEGVSGVFYIAPGNWRDDLLEGVVYMQTPQAKTVAETGIPVACWTFVRAADDQKVVMMPELRGLSAAAAAAQLKDLKLLTMNPAAGKEAQQVADQYPRPRQAVIEGTAVFLQLR